jgi:ankyrin repeat protein
LVNKYGFKYFKIMFNFKKKYFSNLIFIISFLSLSGCNLQSDPAVMLDLAVKNNDIKKIKQLLESGVPAEPKNRKGWTPLMIAVIRDKPEAANLLLKHGANIRARYKSQTLLHMACRWGKTDMVGYLLERGLSYTKRDWLSWTPLMWASLGGKNGAVKALLEAGADVNVKDVDKNTPLILAAWRGHKETARLLIENNADINAVNKDGLSAVGIAKKHDFDALAEELEALIKKKP